MKRIAISILLIFFSLHSIFAQNIFIPTANQELDVERKKVQTIPTDEGNVKHRRNMLERFSRLVTFAGGDISDYAVHHHALKEAQGKDLYKAVDHAFAGMEQIYRDFKNTREGQLFQPRENYYGDHYHEWQLFHGNNQNTGSTEDVGPTKGQLAWKFPTGRPWYSRPSVEDGKVYAVSNGMTTVLYCLDEETGNVNWEASQRGSGHQYGTARMNSSVILQDERCIIREVGSGGNKGHQKHLVYVDKKTGEVLKEEYAGHIDYRVGYAPMDGDNEYVVYPHGDQTIHWAESRTITTFDSVVCRDANTDELLWRHYVGEYWTEPNVDNGQVFVGTTAGEIICLNAEESEDRVAWTFKANSSVHTKINTSKNLAVVGASDGTVYAIDRNTGKEAWNFKIDKAEERAFQQFSGAEISGNNVFIGGADNFLYCLNLNSGELRWKENLGDWIRSKPVVYEENVYAATLDGQLYKFSLEGELAWTKQPTGHQIFADLVSGNGHIFINSSDLYLHCIETEKGTEKWRHSLMEAVYTQNERIWADIDGGGGDFQSPPIVAEGMVIAGSPDRFIHALDHETGKEIWRFENRGQIPAAPIYYDGKIYFGQQGGTPDYYCISAATGKLIWKRELGWGWASANAIDGKVYVPTVSGWVYCLDANTGETTWEYNTENGCYPAPAIEGDVVVFGSWKLLYFGFNKDTGEKLWEADIQGNPDSGAALVKDGKAYLQGLGADYFYCVDLKTGEEIWKYKFPDGYECNMSPSISNGKLYFSIFPNGQVCNTLIPGVTYCLDANTGDEIWQLTGGGGLTGTANSEGKVYFASTNDPYLWCVDEEGNGDGTTNVYWKFKMNGRAEESCVAIAYGKAYILTTDGYVYAIE